MTIDKLVRSPQSLLCAVLRTGLWGLATACRPAPLPPPQPLTPLPPALAVRPASSEPRWLYEISASQPASELRIEAIFPPGTGERMSVDQGAERFISDVDIAENQSWRRLAPDRSGEGWQVLVKSPPGHV